MGRRKKIKNEPISRMIEHFDSTNGGITSIHSWSQQPSIRFCVAGEGGRGEDEEDRKRGTGTNSWWERKRRRGRYGEWVRTTRIAPNFFIPWISDPIRHPRRSRAREYKCSPSRLYNHGSVKLTSQSCNQPQNLAATRTPRPEPGYQPRTSRRSGIFAVPEFKSVSRRSRSTKLSSDAENSDRRPAKANGLTRFPPVSLCLRISAISCSGRLLLILLTRNFRKIRSSIRRVFKKICPLSKYIL